MESKLKFSVQLLLSEKDGKVSAPMSPMLFAEEIVKHAGHKFNRLARVRFADEAINQIAEDNDFTGHDTLIIGLQQPDDLMLTLWVDIGIGGVPIALVHQSDGEILMTKVYAKENHARKLTEAEVKEIFDSIFSDPGQLAIIQK